MKKICIACEEREAKVGNYCASCMKEIKKFRKNEREQERYWKAIENGSGDLWKENY